MLTRDERIQMAAMRIDGYSMSEIGKQFNVSRQYVWTFFNILGGKRVTIDYCPQPAFRKWLIEHDQTVDEFCTANGIEKEDMDHALKHSAQDGLTREMAGKVSMITGIPEAELRTGRSPRKVVTAERERKPHYDRILYPVVVDYLLRNKMPITELSVRTGIPYSQLYNLLTTDYNGDLESSDKHRAIARMMAMETSQVFCR